MKVDWRNKLLIILSAFKTICLDNESHKQIESAAIAVATKGLYAGHLTDLNVPPWRPTVRSDHRNTMLHIGSAQCIYQKELGMKIPFLVV